MKKLNLFMKTALVTAIFVLGSVGVFGQTTVEFVFANQGYTNAQVVTSGTIDSNIDFTATKGTNDPAYYNTGTGLRIYNGGTFVINPKNSVTITSITCTFSGANYTFNNTDANPTIWTGPSTTDVTFSVTQTCRLQKVSVTYSSQTSTVSTPTFSPAAGIYYSAQNVTLLCTTDGATIYYTTNGDTPTSSSAEYTAPIPVSATTTIKAIAYKDGDASNVATATYTLPAINEVATIAALREGNTDGTIYKLTGEAVLTFQTSARNAKYIQDATGAILIDDDGGKITTTYALYDGITGITGTLSAFNSMLQFLPVTDPGTATSNDKTVTPEIVTLADFNSSYQAKLVKIESVDFAVTGNFAKTNYTIEDPTGTGILRPNYDDLNYIGTAIPTTTQHITGIVLQYGATTQFIPRSLDDFETVSSTTPTLSVSPSSLNFEEIIINETSSAKTVTISGTNLTANISYAKDGADATAFTITETSWTAAEGGTLSVAFTPTEARAYSASIVVSSTGAEDKTITLSGTGVTAPTNLILEDSFDYTAGTLLTANGWTAHSGAGTNPITVSEGSLAYLNYAPSGVGNKVALKTSGEDVNHGFPNDITSGTLYTAFMINLSAAKTTGDYFAHLMGQSTSTFVGRVYAKSSESGFVLGVSKANESVVYATDVLDFNTTHLVVMRYEIISGTTNDIVYIYVNPVVGNVEPATADITSETSDKDDPEKIAGFALRQGTASSAPALSIDGVRVARTWDEAVKYEASSPTLSVLPSSLNFEEIIINETSSAKTVTISGTNLTANISYAKDGADAAAFTVTETSWSAAEGGTLSVTFTPTAERTYSASIIVSSTGAENKTITLSGTGVTAVTPKLTVDPASLTFETATGQPASKQVAVTGENLSTEIEYNINGAGASAFSVAEATGWDDLEGGALNVTFSSETAGTFVATLTVTSGGLTETVALSGTATEEADLIWADSFDYEVGTLLTANGWENHSGTTNFITVTEGSLAYLNYAPSGVGNKATLKTSGEDVNHGFPNDITSGTLYAAFMVNLTSAQNTGDYFAHFLGQSNSTFAGRVFAKSSGTGYQIGISRAAAVADAVFDSQVLDFNADYLIVMKYQVVEGTTNDLVSLYINPVVGDAEPATPSIAASDVTGTDPTKIAGFALRQGTASSAPALSFDGVRVARTWAEAVKYEDKPLPATLTVAPAALAFGDVLTGGTSDEKEVAVTGINLTDQISIAIEGTGASAFAATKATGWDNLTGGTLNVTFMPTTTGEYVATLVVSSDNLSKTVMLTGKGVAVATPVLTVDPTSLSFATTAIGQTATAQPVAVSGTNLTGNITHTLTGSGASAFAVTANPWNAATGGALNVAFTPTEAKDYSATITISSAGATSKTVTLTGTGETPSSAAVIAQWNGYTPSSPPANGIFLATAGTAANNGVATLARDENGTDYAVYTDGVAASQGWHEANQTEKYWITTFSTAGYSDLTLTTKQRSSNTGPQDYKLQYKVGAGAWTDVPDGIITVANDGYVSGVKTNLPLPAAMSNQAEVYIRWLCTSTVAANGSAVAAGGVNRLDVTVYGEMGTDPAIIVNPAALDFDVIMVGSSSAAKSVAVSGVNLTGNITYTKTGADASAFTITANPWSAATGGTLNVVFTPSAERDFMANIVVSTPGAANKTVTLKGSGTTTPILPVADFSADKTYVVLGSSVQFTDESTRNPTSWSWTFEGGTPATSNQQHPTVVYNTAGVFDVTLTATNADGSDTKTKTDYITVVEQGNDIVCNGSFESWTGAKPDCWFGEKTNIGTANVVQYSTSAQDGSYATQLVNGTDSHKRFTSQAVSVAEGKTYTITFWARGGGDIRTGLFDDRSGSSSGYATYNSYITVNSTTWTEYSQTIEAANSTDIAEFIFSVRNTVEASDHIQIDNVTIQGASSDPYFTVSPESLPFGDVAIQTTSPAKTLTVAGYNLQSAISYQISGSDAVYFNISEASWNETTGGTLNVTFAPTELRSYAASVKFSASGANDITVSLSGVGVGMASPEANFVADRTSIMIGETVSFTDLSVGPPTSWSWEFEGGTPATSDEQNPAVAYAQSGIYSVTLTVSNSMGTHSVTKEHYISVTENGQGLVCNGGFEEWEDANKPVCWFGEKTTFAKTAVAQYTANPHEGNYAAQLINATSSHKRFTTKAVAVEAEKEYKISFWVRGKGEIRTGLYDGREGNSGYASYNEYIAIDSDIWEQYTQYVTAEATTDVAEFIVSVLNTDEAMDHIQLDDVEIEYVTNIAQIEPLTCNVFPNPSNGMFQIQTNGSVTAQVYSVTGAMLLEQKIEELGTLYMESFPSGVYILRIIDSEKNSTTRKLIIK